MSSSTGQIPTFSCKKLLMRFVMDVSKLDETPLGKWQFLQQYKSNIPPKKIIGNNK